MKLQIITYKQAIKIAFFKGWSKVVEPKTKTLHGDWRDFLLEGVNGFFKWLFFAIGRVIISVFSPVTALLVMHTMRLSAVRHLQKQYWLNRAKCNKDIQAAYKEARKEALRILSKSQERGEHKLSSCR